MNSDPSSGAMLSPVIFYPSVITSVRDVVLSFVGPSLKYRELVRIMPWASWLIGSAPCSLHALCCAPAGLNTSYGLKFRSRIGWEES